MPGGPKSWAQLSGKPVGHEGGKWWVWLGGLSLILAIGNILLELARRTPTLSLLVLQAAMLLGVIMASVTLLPSCFFLLHLALAPGERAALYRYSSRAFGRLGGIGYCECPDWQ